MKKLNKVGKTIALSTVAAIAFGGVALTTTYALFTSEANTNVTVSSGKVKVSSKVEVKEVYSPTAINTDGTISDSINNASADIEAVVSGSDVTITKMLPGDSVTLTITPTNESNVNIKYRERYKLSGDYRKLVVTGNDSMVTNWTTLNIGGTIKAYDITISLPATETETVDEAIISFGIEAVQGNALVYDDVYADTLQDAFNLESDVFSYSASNSKSISLEGNDRTFINRWVDGYITSDTTISGVTFLNGATFTANKDNVTLTFENCTFYACDQSKLTYLDGDGNNLKTNSGSGMCLDIEKLTYQNVNYTIKGCKFIGENDKSLPVYGNKYGNKGQVDDSYKKRGFGIALNAIQGGDGTGSSINKVLIENCEITGVRGNAIQLYGANGDITIRNTKINSWGINSGKYSYYDASKNETVYKDGDCAAIRGDEPTSRTITLEDVYYGKDEGTNDSVNGNKLTHIELNGDFQGNTNGSREKGTYSYINSK